ncbi:MAG: ATP-binding cassette domain-containing protein [Anaerolineae bacterium]
MGNPLVEIDSLSYTYANEGASPVPALHNVSAIIPEGSYVAIIGPNGSGKSTLAKCLNGLLRPTSGMVYVACMDTRDPTQQLTIRATVAMAFQNPDNQFVATTVEEEVAFGPENLGIPQPELGERVRVALEATDLLKRSEDSPRMLSAGEKARLAVAGLLAMRPRCLVLDESTAMLDPVSRARLGDLLRRLHNEGLAIVLITHYMDEAAEAEQVLVLHEGHLLLQGTPLEVFSQGDILRSIGLAPPPALAISHGLQRRGASFEPALTTDALVSAVLSVQEASRV